MSGSEKHLDEYPACKSCGVPFVHHLGIQGTCRELTETVKELMETQRAIARSPFEMGPCGTCGKATVYLEDGMPPLCEPCAKKMEAEG